MSSEIKLKRVDSTIIVVADSILQSTLPEGKDGEKKYKKIKKLIVRINSGLLTPLGRDKAKEKLLDLLTIKKKRITCTDSLSEAYDLADEEENVNERKKKMRKISTIHDKFEYDDEGYAYLKGFSIPIPNDLADALLDAHYNPESKYSVQSLVNFWQWALLNTNSDARNDLFKWFKTGGFSITEAGLVVAYRCVAFKSKGITSALTKFVEEKFVVVKTWKKSPKNYAVIQHIGDNFEIKDLKKYPDAITASKFKGILSDLYADIYSNEAGDVYTDNYSKKMAIKIGEEVRIPRKDCDEDRNASCSRGLHFMSKKYNLRLGEEKLIVLINPMDIVAFPNHDKTKGRSCAYFPVAKALLDEHGDIQELDSGTYDFEYANYGKERLDELFNKHTLNELQEQGEISSDLTGSDLIFMRDNISKLLKDKLVNV